MAAYWLGIDLGTTSTAAAICWPTAAGLQVQVVPLSGQSQAMPSVLFLPDDGSLVVGEDAQRRSLTDPYRVVREFKARIGDEIPLLVGGTPYYAHDLAAEFVSWLCQYVTRQEGEQPEAVALTCPASWGPDKTALLERSVRSAGVPSVTMLTEPEAAAISYASHSGGAAGSTLAVYGLGAARFDVAVLRRESATSFTVLGRPEGIEGLGGLGFDEVIFEYVCAAAGVPLEEMDLAAEGLAAEVAQLRRECTDAKETLSASNDAIISVTLGGTQHWVRLTRAEFEEMIRPDLDRTVEAMYQALGSADVTAAELDAVLLAGGSSRIPLVSQLIAAEFGRPPVVDADPKAAAAMGAARYSAPAATPVQELGPAPATGGGRGQAGLIALLRHPSRKAALAAALVVLIVGGGVTALRTPVLSGLTSRHSNTHQTTASGGLAPSVSGSGSSPTPSAQSSAAPGKAKAATKAAANGTDQAVSGPSSAAATAARASNQVTSPVKATKPPARTSTRPATPPASPKPTSPPSTTPPATTPPSPPPSTTTPPSTTPPSTTPPSTTDPGSSGSSSVTPSTLAAARA